MSAGKFWKYQVIIGIAYKLPPKSEFWQIEPRTRNFAHTTSTDIRRTTNVSYENLNYFFCRESDNC